MNAITDAVRNRKSAWPSVLAMRNASTSSTGRPTSCTHRGIWIVGPGVPICGLIVSRRRACYGPGDDDSALPARGEVACPPAAGSGTRALVRARGSDRRARRHDPAPHRVRRRRRRVGGRPRPCASAADIGAAGDADARDRRERPHPVARRAGRRDRGRVPRLGRGRARPPSGRPAGERGAARAALAPDQGLVEQRARLVPARGRRTPHARRRRRRGDRRLLAGGRNRRRDA